MASNFIPMLSSSPPPIDDNDCFEDEEDNEFGAFKAADAIDCSSSFDIPDPSENSVPDVHDTHCPDMKKNACTENGINGEFSIFSDHTLIHKKGKGYETAELPVNYCPCDNCVLHETLECKMTLKDHHPVSVDRGEMHYFRHPVDTKKLGDLETYSEETETCRLSTQNSFCEVSLQPSDSQSRTKDLEDASQEYSLDSSTCVDSANVSPQQLLPEEEIGDGLFQNLCDDTQGDISVISEVVCHSALQEISRTSNSLDVNSEISSGVDKKDSESVASDNKDCNKSKCTFFSAEQGKDLFIDGEISPETVIDGTSLNLSDVQSYTNGSAVDVVNMDSKTDIDSNTCSPEIHFYHPRIPVMGDLSCKSSEGTDDHYQSQASSTEAHLDFVSDGAFSKRTAETPDEFDDFQQAEFVCYEEPSCTDSSVDHRENLFHVAACSERKHSLGTLSFPSVLNQESENYPSECSTEASVSERSAGDFRTEDSLSTSSFADFEKATFDNQSEIPVESVEASVDSFADFESAASLKARSEHHSAKSSKSTEVDIRIALIYVVDSDKGIGKISAVINAIFPVSEDATPSGITEENFEIWKHNAKSNRLWDKLHEIEQTPGLRFQWGVSHSFQLLLRSVNVDYHSILRTSSVPFFASGLSLLEPTKGPVQPAMKLENEDKIQSRKDLTIPPVHFDWSSSGLVNPLDSTQATSTLMDLSFLSSTESNSPHLHMSSDFGLESEFLEPCCPASPPEPSAKPPILQQLLSSTAVSSLPDSSQSYRPSSMSQEAIHVLDQLPNLSFMRAKVLMFPVSSNI